MKNLTMTNLANTCGGRLIGAAEEQLSQEVTAITTDSRKVTEGCLFVAIRGERVDAHDFVPEVMAKGALCAIVEHDIPDAQYPRIIVTSSLEAVGRIAAFYLAGLRIPVVSITGSVGKTSTKEMIAAVLGMKYRTLKTLGNFNNELGLPLTIFRLREEDEIAVLEMGISDFGEMSRLAAIARPETCVITNIGQCHLENLGDRDGVLRAKTEVFSYLRGDGAVILNGDDDKLRTIENAHGHKPVFFGIGRDSGCSIWADGIHSRGLAGIDCTIHTKQGSFDVMIPIPGQHMVYNALAGCAVGLQYGLTLDEIKRGIESLAPLSGRFHIIETGSITIIDDCYNANPMSMKASLGVLKDAPGRRIAVLGDMGELGADEMQLHRDVGTYAGTIDLDCVLLTGLLSKYIAEGIRSVNPEMNVKYYDTREALEKDLNHVVKKGDTLLVKASHFMQFESIVEQLQK